jgi:hypothetical protein
MVLTPSFRHISTAAEQNKQQLVLSGTNQVQQTYAISLLASHNSPTIGSKKSADRMIQPIPPVLLEPGNTNKSASAFVGGLFNLKRSPSMRSSVHSKTH